MLWFSSSVVKFSVGVAVGEAVRGGVRVGVRVCGRVYAFMPYCSFWAKSFICIRASN